MRGRASRGSGALPDAPGLRLVEVGTATLRSSRLFGDFLARPIMRSPTGRSPRPSNRSRVSPSRPAPLVVAEGIDVLTRAPALANTYRSYAWVWPLGAGNPRLWEIDDLVGTSERARAALSAGSIGYSVQAPVEELRATERSATVAGRRLLLVGGEAAALLFAFAVLGGAQHAPRSGGGPAAPHMVRRAPLAPATVDGRRERIRRDRRDPGRVAHRPRRGRRRGRARRCAGPGGSPRERPLVHGACARGRSDRAGDNRDLCLHVRVRTSGEAHRPR